MRWNELSEENCSMARTVSVIGDRWTLLILRDCFLRVRRFEDFQERLGITRPILASRLKKLVDEFVLVKVPYQQRPLRYCRGCDGRGHGQPAASVILPALRPCAGRRNTWLRTRRGSSVPRNLRGPLAGRGSSSDRRRSAFGLRRVRR